MKQCPSCQSQYTDDSLSFCLQDGTPLIIAGGSQMPTVSYGEQETIVSRQPPNPVYRQTEQQNWQTNPAGYQTSQQTAPKSGSSALTFFFIAVTAVLAICFVGIGVWIFLWKGSPLENSNLLLANANTQTSNKSMSTPQGTRPVTASTPPADMSNANTTSPVDTAQVKTDVSSRINTWKSNAESLDLNSYMSNYAATVDYYNKRGASQSFVRADKQRAFTKYDSIKITLSNLTVTPDSTGNTATAVFDKEWDFSNASDSNSGKVRQQLALKKVNGQWLITAEKDLKVYYVNK